MRKLTLSFLVISVTLTFTIESWAWNRFHLEHAVINNKCDNRHNCDLQRADFRGKNMKKFYAPGAQLHMANFAHADLEGADLRGAHLKFTNLANANLKNADLRGAILTGANLSGANLKGAKLEPGYLMDKTTMSLVDGKDALFEKAKMRDIIMHHADVRDADFKDAEMRGRVQLTGANFRGVDMSKIKMPPVSIHRKVFARTILHDEDGIRPRVPVHERMVQNYHRDKQ